MKKFIYTLMAFVPALAFGATTDLSGVSALVTSLEGILSKVVPLLFAVAIIYFFWGLVQFLRAAGDPKMAEQGKSHMIYGVIAIAVMISIYGLVGWLQSTIGIQSTNTVILPEIPIR